MAALNIQKHFSGLRVGVDRRRGRDPFATGFEDDSDEKPRTSRPKTKAPPIKPRVPVAAPPKPDPSSAIAALDALRDSDDEFLDVPKTKTKKTTDRRPSPAPAHLASHRVTDGAGRRGSLPGLLPPTIRAAELAVGQLAYLDDSSEDERPRTKRSGRRHSPAPRKPSDPLDPWDRSDTPRGDRLPAEKTPIVAPIVPVHTVASPFAGTVSSIQTRDMWGDGANPGFSNLRNTCRTATRTVTKKPSARERAAQKAPQQSAPPRPTHRRPHRRKGRTRCSGWTSRNCTGRVFPGAPFLLAGPNNDTPKSRRSPPVCSNADDRSPSARSSPPTTDDVSRSRRPSDHSAAMASARQACEENRRPDAMKTRDLQSISTAAPASHSRAIHSPESRWDGHEATATTAASSVEDSTPAASLTSALMMSPISNGENDTPMSSWDTNRLTDSIDSIAAKLNISPQTIPEASSIDHSISQLPPAEDLSRCSSTRSIRVPRTASSRAIGSRRSSRRSNSGFSSASPAQTFLSGWGRGDADAAPEPKPDDEGQSIGLNSEFVIGPTINQGAFGVVKEVHSIDEHGARIVRAVKIVLKNLSGTDEIESEKVQLQMEHEVSIWRYLTHPHILKLHSVYETDYATFCVMELNVGGTLHDMVRKTRQAASRNNGRRGLLPHLAKTYAYQLACALRYLHEDIRICHRDVKLENCLVDLSSPDAAELGGILRLCDFGLADFLNSNQGIEQAISERQYQRLSMSEEHPVFTASSVIGTLEYASPKGLKANRKLFETSGDVWAFGVVIYALCTGDLPFRHAMPSKTAELIIRADWDESALRDAAAGGAEVIDLVKGCLERAVEDRFTISDALRSSWFEGCREESEEDSSRAIWD